MTNGGLTTEKLPFGDRGFVFLGRLSSVADSVMDNVISKSEPVDDQSA